MIVTAEIDVMRPTGRKLVRTTEQHKNVAKVNPDIENSQNTYTTDDVFNMCADILNKRYGTNLSI